MTQNPTKVVVPDVGGPPAAPGPAGPGWLGRYRNIGVPIVALIVLVVYFGVQNAAFLSPDSAQNILRQLAFLAVLALAGTFVILIGGIDLSVAAGATLSGILVATWIDDLGGPLAIAAVLLCGAVVGLANGLISTLLRVPSFLVTLGMMSVLNGISNTVSNGGPVSYQSGLLNTLVNESWVPGLPNGTLIAFVLVAVFTVVAFATSYGRHIYAVGGNERAARLSGVRVRAVKLSVFTLSGVVAAIAGIIFTGQASTGVPLGADPSLLNSIAAIVVGGTALSGGVGGPHRTLLGTLVIVILSSGMDITSVDPYTQLIVKGAVVIAAVVLTIDRRRYGTIK
ncbi:ABC transporter permease [Prauserella muralis]|uniref:ABC transporter permease n=1 Tax=Prauserella muralis TaxID=588067 RepID=UPI000DD4BD9F|nr:ABC transporter permease [Prauserella muralis]TWE22316.1 monosaccharide ABC transporter membrane protein (CUT2 family) [Prauserella muralis]